MQGHDSNATDRDSSAHGDRTSGLLLIAAPQDPSNGGDDPCGAAPSWEHMQFRDQVERTPLRASVLILERELGKLRQCMRNLAK
jgi:hypothetical protein